jgi:hypothetical protein
VVLVGPLVRAALLVDVEVAAVLAAELEGEALALDVENRGSGEPHDGRVARAAAAGVLG